MSQTIEQLLSKLADRVRAIFDKRNDGGARSVQEFTEAKAECRNAGITDEEIQAVIDSVMMDHRIL